MHTHSPLPDKSASAAPASAGSAPSEEAEREKRSAALSSVFAAVGLTVLKLVVGLATNSLGIISEALHSGLDMLAAGLTCFAVRFASLPPDHDHPYGHGKIENLSALVEALLLLVTCVWIVLEATDRLFFNPVPVTPSPWAVGVMVVSIIVDYSRSRMLKRMAEKHRSQALEADALHFSTDIFSSAVVLVGLGALYIAAALPEASPLRPWLERADSLAALGVSLIVAHVSYSLGKRAVNVLLDAGDAALAERIRASLQRLPGCIDIRGLRLRHSGPDLFVDVTVNADSALMLEETRHLRRDVEEAVRAEAGHAAVSLEILPGDEEAGDSVTWVRSRAAAQGLTIHAVDLLEFDGAFGRPPGRILELHVEVAADSTLGEAHALVSDFETRVRERMPDAIIITHLEPAAAEEAGKAVLLDAMHIREAAQQIVADDGAVTDCHNVLLRSWGGGLYASFHCRMRADTPVGEAHEAASRLQTALHRRMPELRRVMVHMEPLAKA